MTRAEWKALPCVERWDDTDGGGATLEHLIVELDGDLWYVSMYDDDCVPAFRMRADDHQYEGHRGVTREVRECWVHDGWMLHEVTPATQRPEEEQ